MLQYITRRQFSLAAISAAFAPRPSHAAAPLGPALIRKVFLASQKPSWPRPDVDLQQDISEIDAQLSELEKRHPGKLKFTGGDLLREGTEISSWIRQAADADVLLVFNLSSGLGAILQKVLEAGPPALLFSRPYAGHSWSNFAGFAQKGLKADVLATSDFGELDPYVNIFQSIHAMRKSKVLLISPNARNRGGESYTRRFGTSFGYPSYADLKAAYESTDAAKARKLAEEFTRAAVRVVEPKPQEIVDSMRLYLAIGGVLRQEQANAIAIDCLGGFARGELPAYPCVAFSKLNDNGEYGVCECDLASTMTQIAVTAMTGVPGFVSDPVFDTSRNEVIHAHCVAATRLRGIGGAPSPYFVRSHLEDNKGVSMQVLGPETGQVTVARFAGADSFLLSTGEIAGNPDSPRGCRTKFRTRVKDARKFLELYGAGLHRVVFYGDHTWPLERLARLTGVQIVREG